MTKKNSTQNETPKSLCKLDSSRLLHRIRRLLNRIRHLRRSTQLRRRLLSTEHWGDFSQPKRTSHSSSVNMRGVLAESLANCCGCPAGCCQCQVKTPVHDLHRSFNQRTSDPIDRCECPPGFCRCEESVKSRFSLTSMKLRGGFANSNESGSCGCSPEYSRCEAKTPVHDPYRSLKLRTSDHIDLCECPPGFCRCCEESVRS